MAKQNEETHKHDFLSPPILTHSSIPFSQSSLALPLSFRKNNSRLGWTWEDKFGAAFHQQGKRHAYF
uniref:Uncharacterized protein n=1 Tax=Salix viminalis TaxID=40686 RepID=A0A6N2MJV4_SALVM